MKLAPFRSLVLLALLISLPVIAVQPAKRFKKRSMPKQPAVALLPARSESAPTNTISSVTDRQPEITSNRTQGLSNVEIGPAFGTILSSQTHTESATLKSATDPSFGFGLMANFNLSESFSLESGLYYAPRVLGFEVTSVDKTGYRQETYHALELPLLARFWVGRVFSIGLGGYTSLGVGEVTVVGDRTGFDDKATLHDLDYGLLAGIQVRIPVARSVGLIFDSRYNYGLRDLRKDATDGETRSLRSLRFFGGVAFGL